ncbi:MAG: glycerophosphodiester phosphodiesterase [Oscillospiraceae bacterium]|nr:glycerophosphodiester phosphodiesterase [Oscillospiraceae bacterium]
MSLIYGHRGASGYAPENTLEAFRLSMDMGADGFELDVHMSADGELVVIHDESVDRTTNGTGLVKDLTLAQLKQLDASAGMDEYRGAKIPTLSEVFDLVRDTHHIVNVEIKTDECFYPEIEEKCLALAKEKGVEDRIIYSSFNHFTLLRMRELKPDVKLGMLFGDILIKPWEYAKSLTVDYVHPMKMNIYVPDFIEEAAANNLGINMWTINDEETMLRCLNCGAGIITNYPDIAIKLRDENK